MTKLPLIKAAAKGNIEVVRRLLADGHDVNERGKPLSEKELKAAKLVLSMANNDMEAVGEALDITPLMAAAENGSMEVVEALLRAGADVNAADSLKRTALMIAIEWKNEAVARQLLEAGADPNAKDLSGDPVLTQAIHSKLWLLAHALLDAGAEPQPKAKQDCLPLTAVSNYCEGKEAAELMVRLLDAGAVPSDPDVLQNVVERHRDADMIRRFLRDYPRLAAQTPHDRLLELAGRRRDVEIIRALIDEGIRPENSPKKSAALSAVIASSDYWGANTDFYLPEHRNDERDIECMKVLLAAGAEIEPTDGESPPLRMAIYFLRTELCRWLLGRGANPNFDDDGDNALDCARNHPEAVDPERYDPETERAEREEMARRREELHKIIKLLEDAGGIAKEEPAQRLASERPAPQILKTPVARRRGLCDESFSSADQIMIRAGMDEIAGVLEKDKKFDRVERDVFARPGEFHNAPGDFVALVKLKGHNWAYVAVRRPISGDKQIKAWSKALKAPVLRAGYEDTANVVYYSLFDRGECVESFESDGQWFCGGVEIDPDVQDESDRMVGTDFTSVRRDPKGIDWPAYESEWQFLDAFLRDQNAYLTFVGAGIEYPSQSLAVTSYHDDEATAESIERVDLAYYKLTPAQKRFLEQHPPQKMDPLTQAIERHNVAAVAAAISAGVEVNAVAQNNDKTYLQLAMHQAAFGKGEEIVDLLLEAGAGRKEAGAEPALPGLFPWGCMSSVGIKVMAKLLQAGVDVNARRCYDTPNPFSPGGQTALIKAAQLGLSNYVKMLLARGADVAIADDEGKTALDRAENSLRHVKKERLNLSSPSPQVAMREAAAREIVDLLDAAVDGCLDAVALPGDEQLIEEEIKRLAEEDRLRKTL